MGKTHYNPYMPTYDPYNEDSSEVALCGTKLSEDGDETNDKKGVTCKKCIKKFASTDKWVEETEKHILKDMQGFVDFSNKQIKINNESI